MRGEETIDDGIGGRVERCQTLNKRRNCDVGLSPRDVPVNLQQIEYDVRTPAKNENYDYDESHLDGFDFCSRDDPSGTRSPDIRLDFPIFGALGPFDGGEGLALGPDRVDDDGVAGRDDHRRDDEQRRRHQRHVHLPLPLWREVDPALQLLFYESFLEEDDERRGEQGAESPREENEKPRSPPAAGEVHRVGDGVKPVDAQRHEHVRRRIRHHRL